MKEAKNFLVNYIISKFGKPEFLKTGCVKTPYADFRFKDFFIIFRNKKYNKKIGFSGAIVRSVERFLKKK